MCVDIDICASLFVYHFYTLLHFKLTISIFLDISTSFTCILFDNILVNFFLDVKMIISQRIKYIMYHRILISYKFIIYYLAHEFFISIILTSPTLTQLEQLFNTEIIFVHYHFYVLNI